jgi:hypothetical protein
VGILPNAMAGGWGRAVAVGASLCRSSNFEMAATPVRCRLRTNDMYCPSPS